MAGVQKFKINNNSKIKNIIAVVSGKGGVGKSFSTSTIATHLNKLGYKVGILDADITGPSIPEGFGLDGLAHSNGVDIIPMVSDFGIKLISVNSILEDKSAPVLWRGPIVGRAINQFFSNVYWGELDYLLIDMPPGTGDVALTIFQSIPLDGIVIVSTPQDLVSIIVKKAINMAKMMNIKILGFIENMSYFKCPCCNEVTNIFGTSNIDEVAREFNVKNVVKMPIDNNFSKAVDDGLVESLEIDEMKEFVKELVNNFEDI